MTQWNAINIALMIQDTCKEYTDECLRCPFNIDGCICSDGNEIPEQWRVGELRERLVSALIRKKVEK